MNKIFWIIKMALSDAFLYRFDLLIYVLSGIVRPFVMLTVWLAVIASGADVPFTRGEFIQYYLLVMIVGVFVGVWTSPFLSARIRQGRISPYLVKPLSYLVWDVSQNIGEKIFKFIYLIPITVGILLLFRVGLPAINLLIFISLVLSLIMAFALNYLFDYCIGLLAFWLEDSNSVGELFDMLLFIFSGRLVPLETLPKFWQNIAFYLPFRYTVSFPIEIYLGKLSTLEIFTGLVMQSLWVVLIVLFYKMIWAKGMKRYSSAGA